MEFKLSFVLTMCILSLLQKEDKYGLEISNCISKHIKAPSETVYKILKRIKSEGWATSYISEESNGPPRIYYTISHSGILHNNKYRQEWYDFVNYVIEPIIEVEKKSDYRLNNYLEL